MTLFTGSSDTQHIRGIDIILLLCVFIIFYGVFYLSQGMTVPFSMTNEPKIDLDPIMLPYYGGRSILRIFIAFIVSLLFSIVYGYIAAKSASARKILIPLLDILQSIPVLGFLSATIIMFINLFPHSLAGVEIASIFAIFTSMAWNMTFSFYQSILSEPRDLTEATKVLHLNSWQRFLHLDLPVSIIGLIWNSMMSFGGAWFFLAASEAISVMGQDIQLPGVGSYLAVATAEGNMTAMLYAIVTMLIMILLIDQLFWRPLVVWSQKFKVELSESEIQPTSWVYDILHASWLMNNIVNKVLQPPFRLVSFIISQLAAVTDRIHDELQARHQKQTALYLIKIIICLCFLYLLYSPAHSTLLNIRDVKVGDIGDAFILGTYTLLRVLAALLIGALWTIPVGVAIGLRPKLSDKLQPVIQIIASFPANMIFPFVTILFLKYNFNFEIGSVFLMILGTQWYILFNVIAGAMSIPNDLLEAASVFHITGWQKWRYLILPSIFPHLLTGLITASGGAWNASIVSEIVVWKNHPLVAKGLGAYVSQATAEGNWPQIIIGVMIMCIFVVAVNRFLWRRLYELAESRFHVE